MEKNPTNGELALMIQSLRELTEERFRESRECHERTNRHLGKLNGQVSKNTKFRLRAGVYIGLIAGAASTAATTVTATLISKFL